MDGRRPFLLGAVAGQWVGSLPIAQQVAEHLSSLSLLQALGVTAGFQCSHSDQCSSPLLGCLPFLSMDGVQMKTLKSC